MPATIVVPRTREQAERDLLLWGRFWMHADDYERIYGSLPGRAYPTPFEEEGER